MAKTSRKGAEPQRLRKEKSKICFKGQNNWCQND